MSELRSARFRDSLPQGVLNDAPVRDRLIPVMLEKQYRDLVREFQKYDRTPDWTTLRIGIYVDTDRGVDYTYLESRVREGGRDV